jgi:signal transduction histidine kinase
MTACAQGAVSIRAMPDELRRWLDPALAAVLTVIGLLITFDPGNGDGTLVDSFVIPAATLPVAWRRRAPLAAAAALTVGIVVSGIPTFDQTRCGVAIPAALLILFSLAARPERNQAIAGLGLVLAGLGFLLFTDSQLDAGAAFILPLAAGVWAAGRVAGSRERVAAALAERSRMLVDTRAETAQLAVEVERLRLAADLETAARERVSDLVVLAEDAQAAAEGDPQGAHDAFARIEREGRESLNEMRGLLGVLRSDERDASARPTLEQIEELLQRARAGGTVVELEVEGERRPLPGGVELAAFRTVQHALTGLRRDEGTPARLCLRYLPEALELELHGAIADGTAGEAAVAAARERVAAHGGSFSAAPAHSGLAVLTARLPLVATGG